VESHTEVAITVDGEVITDQTDTVSEVHEDKDAVNATVTTTHTETTVIDVDIAEPEVTTLDIDSEPDVLELSANGEIIIEEVDVEVE